jgi:hypothetical protein
MSAAKVYSAQDPEFNLIGPGLNAANMRSRGWLDESRVWKTGGGSEGFDETIVLRPLVRRDLEGFLAAEMPDGLIVEFRVRKGWDGDIPRSAVLIHHFQAGHSYLTPANSGNLDLIAGDSLGTEEDDHDYTFESGGFSRSDVLDIDPAAEEATVRLRSRPGHEMPVAIDPMALILSGKAYLMWIEKHHPHTPKVAEIREVMATLSHREQTLALARARTVTGYADAVQRAIGTLNGGLAPEPASGS